MYMTKAFDSPENWFNKSSKKTKKSSGAGGGKTSNSSRRPTPPKAKTGNVAKAVKAKPPPQAMVKISGSSKGADKAQAHINYIGRKGDVEIENERGEKFKGKDQKDLIKAWQAMGMNDKHDNGKKREAFHIVFSMPKGTNEQGLKTAVKNMVDEEFAGHKYFIAQHKDTDNPHCHVLLQATDDRGARLNPRKADLHNYRVAFVEKLAEQGIEATASRAVHRFKLQQSKKQSVIHKNAREGVQPNQPQLNDKNIENIKKTFGSVKKEYKAYQEQVADTDKQLKLQIGKFVRSKEKEAQKLLDKDKKQDIER